MSVVSLLGVLLVGLKLAGIIAWPWIWVLAPFWLGLVAILGFGILTLAIMFAKAWRE